MEERGFIYIPLTELLNDTLPDIFIDLSYVENKYAQVSGYGWWYDHSEPSWFNYWNLDTCYPYYPISYTAITSYTTKSFIMDFLYLRETSEDTYNAESCFFGLVRGIAAKYSDKEIAKYINQCFDQTPELKKN
jgi:hypothetical protein